MIHIPKRKVGVVILWLQAFMSTFKVSRYSGSKITFSKKVISTSFFSLVRSQLYMRLLSRKDAFKIYITCHWLQRTSTLNLVHLKGPEDHNLPSGHQCLQMRPRMMIEVSFKRSRKHRFR